MNDFQRNEVALRYEKIIAKKMRERQLGGLKKGNILPLRPNGQNGERTTQRKEMAKIASTSEGSIQRSKLILEKRQ